jgi:hypothetical protein
MLYVTFCYKPDTDMLSMSSARILQLDPTAKIYAVNDAANPVSKRIPGVTFLQSNFPRGGNLNGLAAVAGELAVFEQLLQKEQAEYIVKFDCDLWPNDLEPFTDVSPGTPDYLSVERFEPFTPSGLIYRLSRHMVRELLKGYNARSAAGLWAKGAKYPEDMTIYALAQETSMRCRLIPFASGFTAGMHDGGPGTYEPLHKAGLVHCGEPLADGSRVSREHATLRMRILKHEPENALKE